MSLCTWIHICNFVCTYTYHHELYAGAFYRKAYCCATSTGFLLQVSLLDMAIPDRLTSKLVKVPINIEAGSGVKQCGLQDKAPASD